jgi:hypothetical protein
MDGFTPSALIGLCVGFLWGIGCSLAILYSIYLGGYRKAVKDSLAPEKPQRYLETLRKIEKRRAKKSARAPQQ